MKPNEELTFEEYWERYADPRHAQNKDAKDAARNAWIVCRQQEQRLSVIREAQAEKKIKKLSRQDCAGTTCKSA